MWDYTEKVMDHFRNPRNVGFLADADGVGEVGSVSCGDALRLMFKLDPQGRIQDVKFQTFGCTSAIASSSVLTEMIKGKTLEQARTITNQEIADALGGLPAQKMHCSVMGRDALLAAIEDYSKKKDIQVPASPKTEGRLVCACFGVTEEEIERTIRENRLTSVEQVTNYTKAGGGCGGCHPEIEFLLQRVNGERPKPLPIALGVKKKLTTIQKLQLIQETIDREIRPSLQKDNGDIELIDLDGHLVVVNLLGTCSGCKVAKFTLRDVVQAKLREFVAEDLVVVENNCAEDAR